MYQKLASRSFSMDDQWEFAFLSGDFNPLHLDPVLTRRMPYGEPVVHGIHLVIWALYMVIKPGKVLTSLKVTFESPVRINYNVYLYTNLTDKIRLQTDTEVAVSIDYVAIRGDVSPENRILDVDIVKEKPKERDAAQITGASGSMPLTLAYRSMEKSFPNFKAKLTPFQVAFLLSITRLVGMECPGLRSMFSDLKIDFNHSNLPQMGHIYWQVITFDSRFSMTKISVSTHGAYALLSAILRPELTSQASLDLLLSVKEQLPDLTAVKCLVVGGSRGLGELTAKLLSIAGGNVLLTYNKGKSDAQRVEQEILKSGGRAKIAFLDILNLTDICLPDDWIPDQIYYFASPPIFVATKGLFQYGVFEHFNAFYVRSFNDLVAFFKPPQGSKLRVFYPSSVAVNELPANMGEYSASKLAGETLCELLQKNVKGLTIIVDRLPRLPTDQTATFFPVATSDPIPIMIKNIHAMSHGKTGHH